MNKTLRTKSSNNRIISFVMIIGLFVFSLSGCQQVNDLVNGNTASNSNTATNSNANANANSNATANSNANANTSVVPSNSAANANSQASNTAGNTATKEEIPLTEEAKVFKNNLVGEWIGTFNIKFTENTFEFTRKGSKSPFQKGSYRVLNENTVEFKSSNDTWTNNIAFEDNGNTAVWSKNGRYSNKYTRVNPK